MIARIPEPIFEEYIHERKKNGTDELTTSALLNTAKLENQRALAEEVRRQPPPQ